MRGQLILIKSRLNKYNKSQSYITFIFHKHPITAKAQHSFKQVARKVLAVRTS